jgi:hypothetical protein
MDTWLGDIPLCRKYPILFYLALNQNIAVFDVTWNDWAIRFRVRLQSAVRDKLASLLNRVALNDDIQQYGGGPKLRSSLSNQFMSS